MRGKDMGRRQTNTHGAICMVYESLIPAYLQPGRSHPGGKLGDYCTYPRFRFTSLSRDLSRLQPDFNELQLRQGPAPCGRAPSPPAPAAIPGSGCHSRLHTDTPRAQGHPGGPRDTLMVQGTSLRAQGHPCSPLFPPASDMGKRISGVRPGSFGFSTEERDPKPRAFGSRSAGAPALPPSSIPFSHFLLVYHLVLPFFSLPHHHFFLFFFFLLPFSPSLSRFPPVFPLRKT